MYTEKKKFVVLVNPNPFLNGLHFTNSGNIVYLAVKWNERRTKQKMQLTPAFALYTFTSVASSLWHTSHTQVKFQLKVN